MPRFIILEHTGAPDDPVGRHYDLLLEEGPACRTWRLAAIPEPGGPPVIAVELPPHRLEWLDHVAGEVSGGRGFARRIDAGSHEPLPPSTVTGSPARQSMLRGTRVQGVLLLQADPDGWRVWLRPDDMGRAADEP